ncbi:MAG: F0F1 ATP synthase subunit B [Clostridiales bacterium]|nr:F0F1 ATP synthase subunit B [Clostridiales bacterium]
MMNIDPRFFMLAAEERSLFGPEEFAGYAVTFIIVLINVVVAFFVIKKFIFKPILKMIHQREEAMNLELSQAEDAAREAKENLTESKQAIDDARQRAAAIIDEAKEGAEKQSEVIIKKSHEDAAEILAQAEQDAKRMKRVALEEMKDDLSDLAVIIAQRVLGDAVPAPELKQYADKHAAEVIEEEVKKFD